MIQRLTVVVLLGMSLGLCTCGTVQEPRQAAAQADRTHADVQALIARLNSGDMSERRKAAEMLGEIGIRAKAAAPHLTRALESDDIVLHALSIRALGRLGTAASAAIPALISKLGADAVGVREESARVLRKIGPVAGAHLLISLKDPAPQVRSLSAYCLGECGTGVDGTVSALRLALRDEDERVRSGAAAGLMGLGVAAKKAAPDLARLIQKDPAGRTRTLAIFALGKTCEDTDLITAALVQALGDKDSNVRVAAAEVLGQVGPRAKSHLTKALADDSTEVRIWAAHSLIKIDPKGKVGVDYLAGIVADEILSRKQDVTVCLSGLRAIGELGLVANGAAPTLRRFLSYGPPITEQVKATLQKIGASTSK